MPLKLHSPLPSLSRAAAWINGGPVSPEQLRGAPVLIHFWAIGCHACEEQLPRVARWRELYGPRGLRLVGIHTAVRATPAWVGEPQVARAARAYGLDYPMAVDLTSALAVQFEVPATPAYFLYDAEGKLRLYFAGYYAADPVERMLEKLFTGAPTAPTAAPTTR